MEVLELDIAVLVSFSHASRDRFQRQKQEAQIFTKPDLARKFATIMHDQTKAESMYKPFQTRYFYFCLDLSEFGIERTTQLTTW